MIQITKYPNKYSFIGNPVMFEIQADNPDPIIVTISSKDQSVGLSGYPYATEIGYKAVVDIADVLNSFFYKDSNIYGDTIIIAELEDFILDYQVKIGETTFNLLAIDGGVSNQVIEELTGYGLDMFSYRLNNTERSILFTTRTNSPYIYMKESEIFPFVFLHPGTSISFVSGGNNIITMPAMTKGLACLFDLNSLRKMFYELYHEIPSYIELQIGGSSSSYITLIPSLLTENKYLLRFKNSLGGYEQLEITGSGYITPEFGEDNGYQKYTSNSFFKKQRDRLELQQIITIQTGYKSQDEFDFLMDIIASSRTYFIYPDGTTYQCNITADSFKIPLRITTPTSIELKIELVDTNKFYSPKIDLERPGAWILETGFWNDFSSWKDNKNWID